MSNDNCTVKSCIRKTQSKKVSFCMPHWKVNKRSKRRIFAIEYLGGRCISCKGVFGQYEFDHIDPKTVSFRIAGGLEFSLDKLISELDKCQLLCIPCHYAKTLSEGSWTRGPRKSTNEHGYSRYTNRRCRCDICRESWRMYIKGRRNSIAQKRVLQ